MIEEFFEEKQGLPDVQTLELPPIFSYSQASHFQLCPRSYFYHYVLKLPSPRGAALGFGSAIDSAISYGYEKKMEPQLLSLSEMQNVFMSEFDDREAPTVDWDHEAKYKNPEREHYRRIGPPLLKEYYPVFMKTQPKSVQEKVLAEPATGIIPAFQGYLDIVDVGNEIQDVKTSARKYGDDKHPRNSLQLLSYRYFYDLKVRGVNDLQVDGNIPKVHFHILIKTKTPQVQIVSHQFTRGEIARGVGALNVIYDSIQVMFQALPEAPHLRVLGQTFPPCDKGSWKCSEKWCGFYVKCHEDMREMASLLPF
jgi:hypothetical protein